MPKSNVLPMDTIKTMTPHRWAKFTRLVPTGSEVRAVRGDDVLWHGVMLENYPYDKEEFIGRECEETKYLKRNMKQLHAQPVLRMQGFKSLNESAFLLSPPKWHVTVQYLVNGCWLNLTEVLHLK